MRGIRFSACVPPQWSATAADYLHQLEEGNAVSVYKPVMDPLIWNALLHILRNSGLGHAWDKNSDCSCMSRAEIEAVYRIENTRLWHRYKARLAAMRQDHAASKVSVVSADLDLDGCGNFLGGYQWTLDCGQALAMDLDEKELLHGTSWANAHSIVREGFDNRTCKRAFYGAGVYFACAACKSHQYTCHQHKKCCDALGDAYLVTETRKNERRPPLRSDFSGTFDSIMVKPGTIKGHHNQQKIHQEFAIFDRKQAYPAYVVQYSVWELVPRWYGYLLRIWPQSLVVFFAVDSAGRLEVLGFTHAQMLGPEVVKNITIITFQACREVKNSRPNSWLRMESVSWNWLVVWNMFYFP